MVQFLGLHAINLKNMQKGQKARVLDDLQEGFKPGITFYNTKEGSTYGIDEKGKSTIGDRRWNDTLLVTLGQLPDKDMYILSTGSSESFATQDVDSQLGKKIRQLLKAQGILNPDSHYQYHEESGEYDFELNFKDAKPIDEDYVRQYCHDTSTSVPRILYAIVKLGLNNGARIVSRDGTLLKPADLNNPKTRQKFSVQV